MSTATAKKPQASVKPLEAKEVVKGDIFSEVSHYTFLGHKPNGVMEFTSHATGLPVELGSSYVEKFLKTANQHQREVEVGKEDKLWTESRLEDATKKGTIPTDKAKWPKVGDVMTPGIRTIWENIYSAQVFEVCFQKQDEKMPAKQLAELRQTQIDQALEAIEKASKGKTGVAKAAQEQMKKIQENPITGMEPGKMRILKGYKIQFSSRDGRYDCVDMEIPKGENNIRPVNINTIAWIVFDGVKYIVK